MLDETSADSGIEPVIPSFSSGTTPQRMRILWLSHFVPYPPKGGCFQRSYNLIKRVAAVHDVHLLAVKHKSGTHPEEEVRQARQELLRYCKSVQIVDISSSTTPTRLALSALRSVLQWEPLTVTIYRSREIRSLVRKIVAEQRIEAAHFDTISLAEYLEDVGAVTTVMTHHGAESFMIRRRIGNERNWLKKVFFYLEWAMLERYEARMCPRFSSNVVMSQLDQDILARIVPTASFSIVANGVDIDYFTPATQTRTAARRIVFAGRLDQYSNRHGMLRFMEHAWPTIAARLSDVTIDVIGSNPPPEIVRMAERDPRIKVHGFVPDIRPYFREARVAICPIWDGGGTRIKVLDALAQGIPLVATNIGAEGIDIENGRDLLLADTAEQFAELIIKVFEDADLAKRLASNGRRVAEDVYSWDAIAGRLANLYVAGGAMRAHS